MVGYATINKFHTKYSLFARQTYKWKAHKFADSRPCNKPKRSRLGWREREQRQASKADRFRLGSCTQRISRLATWACENCFRQHVRKEHGTFHAFESRPVLQRCIVPFECSTLSVFFERTVFGSHCSMVQRGKVHVNSRVYFDKRWHSSGPRRPQGLGSVLTPKWACVSFFVLRALLGWHNQGLFLQSHAAIRWFWKLWERRKVENPRTQHCDHKASRTWPHRYTRKFTQWHNWWNFVNFYERKFMTICPVTSLVPFDQKRSERTSEKKNCPKELHLVLCVTEVSFTGDRSLNSLKCIVE